MGVLTETRTAFDRANQAVREVFKHAALFKQSISRRSRREAASPSVGPKGFDLTTPEWSS
jgi:hypothetical protein